MLNKRERKREGREGAKVDHSLISQRQSNHSTVDDAKITMRFSIYSLGCLTDHVFSQSSHIREREAISSGNTQKLKGNIGILKVTGSKKED